MAHETMCLRLVGSPAGHSTHRGRVDFVGLDAAGEEEPYALEVVCEVDDLGSRVHVRAEVRGEADSLCHRCLERFARAVAASFEVTLQRGLEVTDAEGVVGIPDNTAEYDLAPQVREAVILDEPIRLLCRPDCRGLCARCGADLNQGRCGCAPAPDPRWAALDALRRRS
jgi:uncharacterized protein